MTGGLSGKTIAVVGLGREDMLETTAAIERAGGAWQMFSAPDAAALNRVDLVIAGSQAADAIVDIDQPMIVVGALQDVAGHTVDPDLRRDFVIAPPLKGEEIALRAAHLCAASSQRRKVSSQPTVVTADDDPTTTAIVRTALTRSGITCHTAANGKEALEIIRRVEPAVVVLDVHMPFLDGFNVLSAIRQDSQHDSTAVLMLTSVQQEADVVRAFSLGADDYVVKPFNPLELVARIKRLIKKHE
jgi:CheY-like chemotaxis protein